MLDPRVVGEDPYRVARDVQRVLQTYKSLQDIIAILGMDELSEEDRQTVAPGAQNPALSIAALPCRRGFHGDPQQYS